MNINNVLEEIKDFDMRLPTHYILEDGRVWSVEEAKFVSEIPEGCVSNLCQSEPERDSLKVLVDCLHFYNYPLGELKTDEEYASEAREKRNILLTESDYLAMPDYPLDEYKKSAILSYRQLLRDISEQSGFPRNIIWPEKPDI